MALNPTCNDPTDTFANIYYSRGTFVVYATNPFPIAELATQLATVRGVGSDVLVVVTSGLNGDTPYAADGFENYIKQYGGGKPWPDSMGGQPVGDIDADGTRTCNPGPCPTGQHWDLDQGMCVPDSPSTTPPPSSGNGGDTTDPRPDWPIDTITVEIGDLDQTFVVADESTEVLKYLIRLWDLQHGITPPAKLRPPAGSPPPVIKPKPPGKCPPGYTYDPKLEMCVLDITPIPPIPPIPPTSPQPGGGLGPDPDGDEVTYDLCKQLQGYTNQLICAIQGMTPASGGNSDCCDEVVTAIGDVTAQLSKIAASLGAPVQLGPVVTALEAIATAIEGRAPGAPSIVIDTTPIANALAPLAAAAIAPFDQTNLIRIADELAATPANVQPYLDELHAETLLTDEMYDLLSGGGQ
jgi:hypothetical protein